MQKAKCPCKSPRKQPVLGRAKDGISKHRGFSARSDDSGGAGAEVGVLTSEQLSLFLTRE